MWGNGESKLYVKESKLYSWNRCWCLLCERPGEGPWALSLCFHPGFECEWAGVTSGEPVAGLCCAQSSQALLLDRPGCGTCQCVLGAGWSTGRWVLSPQALRQQHFAFLLLRNIPLLTGRSHMPALPSCLCRATWGLASSPAMFGSLSSTGPSFLERRVYCCDDKWGKSHANTIF